MSLELFLGPLEEEVWKRNQHIYFDQKAKFRAKRSTLSIDYNYDIVGVTFNQLHVKPFINQ